MGPMGHNTARKCTCIRAHTGDAHRRGRGRQGTCRTDSFRSGGVHPYTSRSPGLSCSVVFISGAGTHAFASRPTRSRTVQWQCARNPSPNSRSCGLTHEICEIWAQALFVATTELFSIAAVVLGLESPATATISHNTLTANSHSAGAMHRHLGAQHSALFSAVFRCRSHRICAGLARQGCVRK
jgi:hypothetical protein